MCKKSLKNILSFSLTMTNELENENKKAKNDKQRDITRTHILSTRFFGKPK